MKKMENKVMEFQSTRPARGATASAKEKATALLEFQSTRPARGATDTD